MTVTKQFLLNRGWDYKLWSGSDYSVYEARGSEQIGLLSRYFGIAREILPYRLYMFPDGSFYTKNQDYKIQFYTGFHNFNIWKQEFCYVWRVVSNYSSVPLWIIQDDYINGLRKLTGVNTFLSNWEKN